MAKRMNAKTSRRTPARHLRQPTDLTLRNLHAIRRSLEVIETRLQALETMARGLDVPPPPPVES